MVDLLHPVGRAPLKHLAPVIKKCAQHFLHRTYFRRHPVDQDVHVQRESHLKIRAAIQHPHQDLGINVLGTRLDDQANIVGRFVAYIAQNRNLLGLNKLCNLFDQLGFLYLIGNFSDDNLPSTAPQILCFPPTAQTETALTRTIGIRNVFRGFNDNTAGRKIGAGNVFKQGIVAGIGRFDQVDTGVHQFRDVMRRDVGGHTDSNTRRPVCQEVRELRGQNGRLGQCAVVILSKIDSIFIQTFQHGLGHGGHARFGISARSGVIPVDVAKVPLPVNQRITHVKILRETRHRIVNRSVAVRVIVPHHVAGNFRRLPESPGAVKPQFTHRE